MDVETLSPVAEVGIWMRILYPEGKLTQQSARVLLRLSFPEKEKRRMRQLSTKAQAGTLTPAEDNEMEGYERAGAMMSILKSKARQVLKSSPRGN